MEILSLINTALGAITKAISIAEGLGKKNGHDQVDTTEQKSSDVSGQATEGSASVAGFKTIQRVNGKSLRFVRRVSCNTCGHSFGIDFSDHQHHDLMDADLFAFGIVCTECNSPDVI